jgi:ribosomal protein S30
VIPEGDPVTVGAQFKPKSAVVPQSQDRINYRVRVLPWHDEADVII